MDGFFNGAQEIAEFLVNQGEEKEEARQDLLRQQQLHQQEIKTISGVSHRWSADRHMWVPMEIPIPQDEPTPKALEFFTLGGLVDYINENNEGLIPTDGSRVILQVVDERTVKLISQPSLYRKDRHTIAYAVAHTPEITFGRYMDADTFCTELMSKFVETDARSETFKAAKNMTKEQTAQVTDNGVGQQITVREGVSLASTCEFRNPVPLAPRRTFSEVAQPESNFTLRVNREAQIALFESDGGAWKNEAVNLIREYLTANTTNSAVIVIA